MEITFTNNWNSQVFLTRWSLIELSYESLDMTSRSQNTITIGLLGFEVDIFWTNYWI